MTRWKGYIKYGETIRWQGRPAPRAYTFRHWRWSAWIFCFFMVTLSASFITQWDTSLQLPMVLAEIQPSKMLLFLLVSFWVAGGPLFYSRLAWENEFYALTERRLLIMSGLFGRRFTAFSLDALALQAECRQGPTLATIKLKDEKTGRRITLCCLEHPELFFEKFAASVETSERI